MDQPRPPFTQAPAMVPMMPPMMVPTPIPPPTSGAKPSDSRSPSAPGPPQNLVWCYNPSLMMPPAVRMFMPMMGVGGPMMAPPMMVAPPMMMAPMMPMPPPTAPQVVPSGGSADKAESDSDDDAPLDLSKKSVSLSAATSRTELSEDTTTTAAASAKVEGMEIKNEPATTISNGEGTAAKPCYKKNMLKRYQGELCLELLLGCCVSLLFSV